MNRLQKTLDKHSAALMFSASLASLVLFAALSQSLDDANEPTQASVTLGQGLFVLYPLFVLEFIVHRVLRSPFRWWQLLHLLVPPTRLVSRDHATGRSVWLPRVGWGEVDRELLQRVERAFSGPMIVMALLVLPVLAVEYLWAESIREHAVLGLVLRVCTGLIWLSFALEFIVMISLVEKRWRYCREHWVDIMVISLPLLPFFAFLRALRLGQILRLKMLLKLSRVYRLRGLALRAFRALLFLDVISRFINSSPEKRLARLRDELEERETELEELRVEMRQLEALIAARDKEDAETDAARADPPQSTDHAASPQ